MKLLGRERALGRLEYALMPRAFFTFVCVLGAMPIFAQTQRPAYSDPAGGPFLVRLQRIRSDTDVCAIVRLDGLFHLESETATRINVSEGVLDNSELSDLDNAVNNKELSELTQQRIAVPLLTTDQDEFRISVLHSIIHFPFTQNLTFLDRESRRPFDDFINPLLRWMDVLQHHPRTSLGGFEGRNNCMPPKKLLEFSTRRIARPPAEPESDFSLKGTSASTPAVPQKDAFLMRWEFNHVAEGTVQDTCVIVYPSGQYRMEKTTQDYHEKLRIRAFADALSDADVEGLRTLLDQPELKSSTHRNFPEGKVFREAELTTLSVSREGHVQQLSFASYFGVPGWVSNVSAGTDPEERIVSPLRKWLKEHVESKKTPPIRDAVQTHCQAQPGESHP